MGFKRSGIHEIDSLLKGKYWNDTGKPVTLTYSYDVTGKDGLNREQRDMIFEALNQWRKVANINFNWVPKGGDLRFKAEDIPGGNVDYKEAVDWWNPFSYGTNKLKHVNIKLGKNLITGKGNDFLEVALHEIGHAIGLKHPGRYDGDKSKGEGPFLAYSQDHNTNTVMSYNHAGSLAVTPMPYDIRAVQYLYGARSFNPFNTRYKFSTIHSYKSEDSRVEFRGRDDKVMKLTIWDSGGEDTLDFSKLAFAPDGYHLDIREGGILATKFNLEKDAFGQYYARDNTKDTKYSDHQYRAASIGTAIAYGTHIENAIGTSSFDEIIGNGRSNRIEGKGGNDIIKGGGGSDTVYGDSGNDRIYADGGHDKAYGGSGDDFIAGWYGNDYLSGGSGSDRIYGDDGHDTVYGGSGNDVIWGESDNPNLNRKFGAGNDKLYGGTGHDEIHGGKGNDLINGDSGNDKLYGNYGDDRIYAGRGDDKVYGSSGDDFIAGWYGDDYLSGGFGDDRIYADDGDDVVRGGFGDDIIWGESDNYKLNQKFVGGNDDLSGEYGHDKIYGGKGNDSVKGGAGNDRLYGQQDHDTIDGGRGEDYLSGGSGNDILVGGDDDDVLRGGTGADMFRFSSLRHGVDQIRDFTQAQGDKLQIVTSGFGGGLVLGLLDASQFVLGSVATNASDRFVYNQNTGSLAFDVDGSGSQAAVQFANLAIGLNLSAGDFVLV
ncbi:Iron-regulated protein FrpC [Halomicronema hongdechloris C2206]|uniref:Iron-regulated protein FrpC n=1 Tax=Halomicronema hongdechloris C2206 TaxID=1641165 RepID=A0A1Z3HQW6_9CYAN|nr:matrixin family metalloprotease [Halomicronema hongdechloris]ASC72701.1 Iron-regulated protein FrpC [Halomicronema hongdechloris C2206]